MKEEAATKVPEMDLYTHMFDLFGMICVSQLEIRI